MKQQLFTIVITAGFILLISSMFSCKRQEQHYVVGVSQCSDDSWRTKMNEEMKRELLFHPELEITICQAGDNSAYQCQQIDSLVETGIDLLVVCPNEAAEVEPAITRAYRSGLPVIVADRMVDGNNYTAFIGGDNMEVGRILGQYVRTLSTQIGGGKILVINGLKGSTPAEYRKRGMYEALEGSRAVKVVGEVDGYWFADSAYKATKRALERGLNVNIIVAQNDLMACGARRATDEVCPERVIHIIGVDALSGAGNGIEAVHNGILDASVTYASRGDMIIARAAEILEGKPFIRDTVLPTAIVTPETAHVLYHISNETEHSYATISLLQEKISGLWETLSLQRTFFIILFALFILVLAFVVIMYFVHRYRMRVHAERLVAQHTIEEQAERLEKMGNELARVQIQASQADKFMQNLQREIELHIEDNTMNVRSLSRSLGVSRAQLFRKTRALTGCTPIDLIRSMRLKRAQKLIQESDDSIQTVAYSVGFTSPSYFSKCYREQFGISPTDEKRQGSRSGK